MRRRGRPSGLIWFLVVAGVAMSRPSGVSAQSASPNLPVGPDGMPAPTPAATDCSRIASVLRKRTSGLSGEHAAVHGSAPARPAAAASDPNTSRRSAAGT